MTGTTAPVADAPHPINVTVRHSTVAVAHVLPLRRVLASRVHDPHLSKQ